MKRITITLESSLADALRAEAKKDDRAISSVARKALLAYFAKQPKSAKKEVIRK